MVEYEIRDATTYEVLHSGITLLEAFDKSEEYEKKSVVISPVVEGHTF